MRGKSLLKNFAVESWRGVSTVDYNVDSLEMGGCVLWIIFTGFLGPKNYLDLGK